MSEQDQTGDAGNPPEGDTSGDATNPTTGDGTSTGAQDAQSVDQLPAWAQKIIRDARKESATNRSAKTAAEQERADTLKRISEALGLSKDQAPDPEALAKDLESRSSELKAARGELAVIRAATASGADAEALTDSTSFMRTIGKLDPADPDYMSDVAKAVKEFISDNPRFRAAQAPPRSATTPGSTGADSQTDPMAEAVARAKRVRQGNNLRR